MQDLLREFPIIPVKITEKHDNGITNIVDGTGKFCGFFQLDENSQIVAYDNLGRFTGYYVANSMGNTERYDAIGIFDGYIVPDKNLTKYDKKGAYQGY